MKLGKEEGSKSQIRSTSPWDDKGVSLRKGHDVEESQAVVVLGHLWHGMSPATILLKMEAING